MRITKVATVRSWSVCLSSAGFVPLRFDPVPQVITNLGVMVLDEGDHVEHVNRFRWQLSAKNMEFEDALLRMCWCCDDFAPYFKSHPGFSGGARLREWLREVELWQLSDDDLQLRALEIALPGALAARWQIRQLARAQVTGELNALGRYVETLSADPLVVEGWEPQRPTLRIAKYLAGLHRRLEALERQQQASWPPELAREIASRFRLACQTSQFPFDEIRFEQEPDRVITGRRSHVA